MNEVVYTFLKTGESYLFFRGSRTSFPRRRESHHGTYYFFKKFSSFHLENQTLSLNILRKMQCARAFSEIPAFAGMTASRFIIVKLFIHF
jgi:hypothetical protein